MEEQYCINDIASVIARVLSEAISRFHNGELVTTVPRHALLAGAESYDRMLYQSPFIISHRCVFHCRPILNAGEYVLYHFRRIIPPTQIDPEIPLSCLKEFWNTVDDGKWPFANDYGLASVIDGDKSVAMFIFDRYLPETTLGYAGASSFHIRPHTGLGDKKGGVLVNNEIGICGIQCLEVFFIILRR